MTTKDAFSGPCSRCGREIRLDSQEHPERTTTLVLGAGRMERICDECRERESRQRAGFCRICEHELENAEGLEGPICSDCHRRYLAIQDWPAYERGMRARWNVADPDHVFRVRLVNLRLATEQYEQQHLERFPMVVRPRRADV